MGAGTIRDDVRRLVSGEIPCRITEFYQAKKHGQLVQIHSTAPGATEVEIMGIFRPDIHMLRLFFEALDEVMGHQSTIRKDSEAKELDGQSTNSNSKPRSAEKAAS